MAFCDPSTDEAYRLPVVEMSDNNQPTGDGLAEKEQPLLSDGMIGVVDGHRERVSKSRRCFVETYAVLSKVTLRLVAVPLELHCATVARRTLPHGLGRDRA